MIIIIGLVILVAAVVADVASVLSNSGSGQPQPRNHPRDQEEDELQAHDPVIISGGVTDPPRLVNDHRWSIRHGQAWPVAAARLTGRSLLTGESYTRWVRPALSASRSTNFWIFPVDVFGRSAVKTMSRGAL